jgi:large subunit ribosomal protein L10
LSEAVVLRAEKAELIEDMSSVFRSSGVVVLTHYKGMTVAEMGDLRGQMRKVGASLRVTKNLLAKRALEGTAFEPMIDLFKGPTAIAVSADPTAAPKVIVA